MKKGNLKHKRFLLVSTALVSLLAFAKPADANQTQTTTTTWTYSLPTSSASTSSSTSVSGTCPASSSSGGDGGGNDGVDNDGDGLGDAPSGNGTPTADCCSPAGAGSDGGGGGSVLCTYFFSKGMLSEHIYYADLAYGKERVAENTLNGYHSWAVPMVRYLRAHPDSIAEKVAYFFVQNWTQEMAYVMGASDRHSVIGKIMRVIGEPICGIIGKFSGAQNWQSLYRKESLAN